jgi:hypothetical protein
MLEFPKAASGALSRARSRSGTNRHRRGRTAQRSALTTSGRIDVCVADAGQSRRQVVVGWPLGQRLEDVSECSQRPPVDRIVARLADSYIAEQPSRSVQDEVVKLDSGVDEVPTKYCCLPRAAAGVPGPYRAARCEAITAIAGVVYRNKSV